MAGFAVESNNVLQAIDAGSRCGERVGGLDLRQLARIRPFLAMCFQCTVCFYQTCECSVSLCLRVHVKLTFTYSRFAITVSMLAGSACASVIPNLILKLYIAE